ncbi:hypothetical protein HOD75_03715 [archaeon]|jgi:hypothetical protein|nr:hypothetical protein [archaeon]MBT4241978.1 hypothetical protein [archaeon]MBT4418525.1 hypothetical protein [archaeon]
MKKKKVEKGFKGNLKKEILEAEKWMHERKRFLIKLAWVVGFITILLIFSNFYLNVKGV